MPGKPKKVGIPRNVSSDKFRVAQQGGKTKLFAKFNHKWYSVALQDVFEISNEHNFKAGSILAYDGKNKGRLIPSITADKDGILTIKDKNRGTGVKLKNESGVLKVRNLDDDGDADVQCASIKDVNGNKLLEVNPEANSVNYVKMTNSTAANKTPAIAAVGDTTNINLKLDSKGTGDVIANIPSDGGFFGVAKNDALTLTVDPHNPRVILRDEALRYSSWTMNDDVMEIGNFDVNNDRTNTHIKISAADDLYLAAGANDIWLYAGGTGQNGATFDIGSVFGNFGTGGGSYINHTATSSTDGFKIDSNLSGDSAQWGRGLWVDYDRTVASSGTAAMIDIGIDVDVNSASLGTGLFYGIAIDVVGNTSGTSTSTGIYIDSDGSDTNIGAHIITSGTHLKLSAEADPTNDYGTIAVADTGDMTIATVGDGTTDSDLILDIDGDIELNADGGDIAFKDNTVTNIAFTGPSINMFSTANASDFARINVGSNGATNITSTDDDAALAHISLIADGDITLDSISKDIYFNAGLQKLAKITENEFNLYDDADDDDYFNISIQAGGTTTLKTQTDTGSPDILYRAAGRNIFKANVGGPYIFELAAAGADEGGHGQIWVKDDTPNNL